MKRRRLMLGALLGALPVALLAVAGPSPTQILRVSAFAEQGLAGWEEQSFRGRTRYRVVRVDAAAALEAHRSAAASGLVKKVEIDLLATPFVNWSWKVPAPLRGLDETTRGGDDHAARVYVVRAGGPFFWRTRALSYVWSGSRPRGASWPNAYTASSHVVSVRGRDDPTNVWRHEKRNLRDDFRRYHGMDVARIDAVAVMTDTDDSGRSAQAYYREIFFSAR